MKPNWKEYVAEQAENFGVSFETAWLIFQTVGSNEAYDAFLTELEDAAMYEGFLTEDRMYAEE